MRRRKWTLVLAQGHRYFMETEGWDNKVAVADNSGAWPEDTDDGLMWLDRGSSITMKGGRWFIPLRGHRDGEVISSLTPAGWHEVVAVAHQWRMKIEAPHTGEEVPLVKAIDKLKPCSVCGEMGADHQDFDCGMLRL